MNELFRFYQTIIFKFILVWYILGITHMLVFRILEIKVVIILIYYKIFFPLSYLCLPPLFSSILASFFFAFPEFPPPSPLLYSLVFSMLNQQQIEQWNFLFLPPFFNFNFRFSIITQASNQGFCSHQFLLSFPLFCLL